MRLPLIVLAAGGLAGCMVGPNPKTPPIALSPSYLAPATIRAANDQWWTAFGDAMLERLVGQALAQNLDISVAAARVAQARAAATDAQAALLPRGELNLEAERDRQSLRTPVGAVAKELGLPRDYSLYQAGAAASWELDLFGGLRRGRQAARADLAATEAQTAAVRLSVSAETADAYLQLRGLQARLDVASRQLDTERRLAAIVREQIGQGVVAERELNRVTGEAQGLEAGLAPLRAQIAAQSNRLAVLTGRQAGAVTAELLVARDIPIAPDPSGGAVPSALMRRRPDLVAAEHRVAAADARIGVAVAEYYPRVSLSGLLGVASVGTGRVFIGDALQAGGSGALRWRLFDFGRVDAEVAQARGARAEALAQFRGSVLRATEEVETALTRLTEGRTEISLRERQLVSLTRSRDQARQAYEGGVLALVDVLDADRALLDAADRLAASRADTARASVAAIRALGGGWET